MDRKAELSQSLELIRRAEGFPQQRLRALVGEPGCSSPSTAVLHCPMQWSASVLLSSLHAEDKGCTLIHDKLQHARSGAVSLWLVCQSLRQTGASEVQLCARWCRELSAGWQNRTRTDSQDTHPGELCLPNGFKKAQTPPPNLRLGLEFQRIAMVCASSWA